VTRRIRTTRQAQRLRHRAELILAKRRVDAVRAEQVWAVAHAFAAQADRWALGRAEQIRTERAQAWLDKRAEIKGEQGSNENQD